MINQSILNIAIDHMKAMASGDADFANKLFGILERRGYIISPTDHINPLDLRPDNHVFLSRDVVLLTK